LLPGCCQQALDVLLLAQVLQMRALQMQAQA
jgi:hypothetical protein